MKRGVVEGKDIIAWRGELGISQKQLASFLGLTRNTVGSWETDAKPPPKWLYTWFIGYRRQYRQWHKNGPDVTPETIEKILEEYVAGEKVEVISLKYGVHRQYPGKLAERMGIATRPPHRPRKSEPELHIRS